MKTLFTSIALFMSLFVQAQICGNEPVLTDEQVAVAAVKDFLESYQRGDHERVKWYLREDVVWHQPGTNRLSGIYRTREEVLKMGARMGSLSAKTLKLEAIKSITVHGNQVACLLRWTAAQPTGNVLDVENVDVYTIDRGQIVEVKVFSADLAQEDKFWGADSGGN